MWYAVWNKVEKYFEIYQSATPIAHSMKSHTKQGLWRQIRNNFAYINRMRKHGSVEFRYITSTQTKRTEKVICKTPTSKVVKGHYDVYLGGEKFYTDYSPEVMYNEVGYSSWRR